MSLTYLVEYTHFSSVIDSSTQYYTPLINYHFTTALTPSGSVYSLEAQHSECPCTTHWFCLIALEVHKIKAPWTTHQLCIFAGETFSGPVCVGLYTSYFKSVSTYISMIVRTNVTFRPRKSGHFWKARTFWPVLTFKGLFEGSDLLLRFRLESGQGAFLSSVCDHGYQDSFGVSKCPFLGI